jgi:hypothetical protein
MVGGVSLGGPLTEGGFGWLGTGWSGGLGGDELVSCKYAGLGEFSCVL